MKLDLDMLSCTLVYTKLMVADVGMEKWAQRHGASNLETVEEQAKRPRHSSPTAVKSHLLREKDFEK